MSVDGSDLGGRLPLYDSEALDPAQKELYDWLMNVAVPWAEAARFRASIEGGRLIGPFNPALADAGHFVGLHRPCGRRAEDTRR